MQIAQQGGQKDKMQAEVLFGFGVEVVPGWRGFENPDLFKEGIYVGKHKTCGPMQREKLNFC